MSSLDDMENAQVDQNLLPDSGMNEPLTLDRGTNPLNEVKASEDPSIRDLLVGMNNRLSEVVNTSNGLNERLSEVVSTSNGLNEQMGKLNDKLDNNIKSLEDRQTHTQN